MRHLISILLENETGALSRVVGLFSQRGYNIETLTVAPTEDPHMSRITISTVADDIDLEQIKKEEPELPFHWFFSETDSDATEDAASDRDASEAQAPKSMWQRLLALFKPHKS